MKKSIYILLCILLSACAATTPAPSATPKAMDTVAPKASSTPTVAVTAIVQASNSKQTSKPAPTLMPVLIQPFYNLPDWLAKPNTNIVATITDWKNSVYQLSFFGENITEKYEIVIPENLKGYFWQDATHFGFLNQDNTVYILDLQTGKTSSRTISSENLRFIEDPTVPDVPKALVVSKPIGENQDFFFVFARMFFLKGT